MFSADATEKIQIFLALDMLNSAGPHMGDATPAVSSQERLAAEWTQVQLWASSATCTFNPVKFPTRKYAVKYLFIEKKHLARVSV